LQENFAKFKTKMQLIAADLGESVLATPKNPISFAISLRSFGGALFTE
jgi:hypothetical protein